MSAGDLGRRKDETYSKVPTSIREIWLEFEEVLNLI